MQTKPIRAINTKGLNLAPSLTQDIVQLSTVSKGTEVISKNNKNLQQLLQRLNSSDEKFGRYTLENLGVDDVGVYLTEKGYRGPKIYIEGGDMSNLDFRKGFLKAFQLGGHQTARVSSNGAITILEPYKGNINQRMIVSFLIQKFTCLSVLYLNVHFTDKRRLYPLTIDGIESIGSRR